MSDYAVKNLLEIDDSFGGGGDIEARLDDEAVELKVFDVVRVAPHVVRAFEAGPEGLEVVAVGGRKPEEGDGVYDKGRWPAG
jgi:hypothetical protein